VEAFCLVGLFGILSNVEKLRFRKKLT